MAKKGYLEDFSTKGIEMKTSLLLKIRQTLMSVFFIDLCTMPKDSFEFFFGFKIVS